MGRVMVLQQINVSDRMGNVAATFYERPRGRWQLTVYDSRALNGADITEAVEALADAVTRRQISEVPSG